MKHNLIAALRKVVAWEDQLPGGLADKHHPSEFDREALNKGVRVELEHTDDPNKALEIAMDHLLESPDYYTKLVEFEKTLTDE